ncbi:uncharacterized protein L3040_002263 [Drepanopeziza brunnea f. sp. 'multigermtubi']|uniref:Histone H4 n=1 Tax=Marssonina brunnea f. sp. multigermtubi (strain MB_m1) TaxID=1072389 RepID=K1Y4F9_MARBU|nr:uncharacterized protein MBM_02011 [Drepanopeziza brunnea f. sp. 'multigermtubi' MB_m1]EKD20059.1 hypothetical protein MBM_02011 [Drepanopeziza brunnea f. sp. 'multigermtubi' MB_m1]KAJ5050380.1 hypothetical protein L3040_002263 [Drepanopeziza brunnea f. sp. 'multigermtubi']
MPPFTPVGRRSDGRPSVSGKGSKTVAAGRGKASKGLGLGRAGKGKGLGVPLRKQSRKMIKDTIQGVTKGDIRRLARRGGVKRISAGIYDQVRSALKDRLSEILRIAVTVTEYQQRKTCTVMDVVFALKRLGRPIYGFDSESFQPKSRTGK